MSVKAEVVAAIGEQPAAVVGEALADLSSLTLSSRMRWRVTQLQNLLLEREADRPELEEP